MAGKLKAPGAGAKKAAGKTKKTARAKRQKKSPDNSLEIRAIGRPRDCVYFLALAIVGVLALLGWGIHGKAPLIATEALTFGAAFLMFYFFSVGLNDSLGTFIRRGLKKDGKKKVEKLKRWLSSRYQFALCMFFVFVIGLRRFTAENIECFRGKGALDLFGLVCCSSTKTGEETCVYYFSALGKWLWGLAPGLWDLEAAVWSYALELVLVFLIGIVAWRMMVVGWFIFFLENPKRGLGLKIKPDFLHPDRCAGLAQLGNLCLLNATILAMPIIYLGGWLMIVKSNPIGPDGLELIPDHIQMIVRVVFPVHLSIIMTVSAMSFFLPLYRLHAIMAHGRGEWLRRVDRVGREIHGLSEQLFPSTDNNGNGMNVTVLEREIQRRQRLFDQAHPVPAWPLSARGFAGFLLPQIMGGAGALMSVIKFPF